jgi:hypothetical protein
MYKTRQKTDWSETESIALHDRKTPRRKEVFLAKTWRRIRRRSRAWTLYGRKRTGRRTKKLL